MNHISIKQQLSKIHQLSTIFTTSHFYIIEHVISPTIIQLSSIHAYKHIITVGARILQQLSNYEKFIPHLKNCKIDDDDYDED